MISSLVKIAQNRPFCFDLAQRVFYRWLVIWFFSWGQNAFMPFLSSWISLLLTLVFWNLRYWKSYDVTKTLWRHCFLGNANHKKPIRQFLLLNTLYPFAFVLSKKDESCPSFRSFCFQVTWLTIYGHDYRKWWQPPVEETWPKTNPRILRELKIWRLKVIHSNHFELFCS